LSGLCAAGRGLWGGIGSALAVTGLGGMLAVIAGRVREMYADACPARKEMPDS
jgi:hypothetical protein